MELQASLVDLSMLRRPRESNLTSAALGPDAEVADLRAAAAAFEAIFLAEMLRHTGLAEPPAMFNGGPGERAFSSLLIDAHAQNLADAGGLGLADAIYADLRARADP